MRAHTGERWEALRRHGARRQRLLWTSTTVRNPACSDTRYVDQLLTRGSVNALTEETLRAVADHAVPQPANWSEDTYADARRVLGRLGRHGISLDETARRLEEDGLRQSVASWSRLLHSVAPALTSAPA